MKKAIIFDMDGVLILTEELHFKILEESLKKCGVELAKKAYVDFFIGRTIKDGVENYLKSKKKEAVLAKKVIENFQRVKKDILNNKIKKHIPLREHTEKLLEFLRSKGYKLAIGTSTRRVFIEPVVKSLGIEKYFDVIVAGDEVINGKPNPEIYLKVAEKLGCTSDECIVIEDTPQGIYSAKGAGMQCIAIKNNDFKLDLSKADEIVSNFKEIEKKL